MSGQPVSVRARGNGTAAYLKEMIQAQLSLSPRLKLFLVPDGAAEGEDLRDDAIIAPYASGGTQQVYLSAAPRPLSDFAPGVNTVPLTQVRVRTAARGQAYGPALVIKPVKDATTVAQLKATLIANARNFPNIPSDPAQVTLYFSPVFITADVLLGRKQRAALTDSDNLAACQIVNDDIIYLEYQK